jgi:uncharacterized protein (DUF1499 family)
MNKNFAVSLLSFIFLMGCSGTIPTLGINEGQLQPCPDKPNCVSTQATDRSQFIEPIEFNSTAQQAQDRLLQVLKTMDRTKIVVNEENYIRVEFTSKIFRFVDDGEFYFQPAKKGEIIIHLRSASRIGHSDFGVNRERIEQIRKQFKMDI